MKKSNFPIFIFPFHFPAFSKIPTEPSGLVPRELFKTRHPHARYSPPPPLPTRLESGMSIRAPVTAQEAQAPAVR